MDMEMKAFGFEFEAKEDGNGAMVIEGYGSTFGNKDHGGDVVERGAFAESLKRRMPKMLWQHNMQEVPGVWEEAYEDTNGLYLKGRFIDTTLGRDVYTQAKEGAIDKLSIGYSVMDYEQDNGVRRLKSLNLFEVSLVTFPMNEQATVVAVKNQPQTVREFEQFLRDAGFSKAKANAIASHGFKAADSQRDVESTHAIEALTTLSNYLKGNPHG